MDQSSKKMNSTIILFRTPLNLGKYTEKVVSELAATVETVDESKFRIYYSTNNSGSHLPGDGEKFDTLSV